MLPYRGQLKKRPNTVSEAYSANQSPHRTVRGTKRPFHTALWHYIWAPRVNMFYNAPCALPNFADSQSYDRMTFRWEIQRYHIKGLLGDERVQPDQRMSGEFNRIRAWAYKKNRSKPNFQQVRRLTGLTLPPSWGIEPNTSCRVNGACNASMPNFAKSHCALRRVGQRQWAALHFSLVCHCLCETEVPLTIQLQAWGSVCKETENCDVNHWTNVMNRIILHTHQLIRVLELGSQWTRWSAIGFLAMCLGMLVPLWKHSTSPW